MLSLTLSRSRAVFAGRSVSLAVLALVLALPCFGDTASASQTVDLVLPAAFSVTSAPATVALVESLGSFSSFSASTPISFRVRTSITTGAGALTGEMATNFVPLTGPNILNSNLSYTCSAATYGTACSGSMIASLSLETAIITVGPGACTGGGAPCSSSNPNSVTLSFTLTNSPTFSTGSYSANLTYTASAI